MLHSEGKPSDDAIKHFVYDVSDLYMKVRDLRCLCSLARGCASHSANNLEAPMVLAMLPAGGECSH